MSSEQLKKSGLLASSQVKHFTFLILSSFGVEHLAVGKTERDKLREMENSKKDSERENKIETQRERMNGRQRE